MNYFLPAFAGLITGILSAWGVGGGSLLIIYMTVFAGMTQQTAQGVNLLYFLPTSLTALYSHLKNKLVDMKLAYPAIITGVLFSLGASYASAAIDKAAMKKIFGIFIIIIGISELFRKKEKHKGKS